MGVLVLVSVLCPAGWAGSPVALGLVQGGTGHVGDWHEGFEWQHNTQQGKRNCGFIPKQHKAAAAMLRTVVRGQGQRSGGSGGVWMMLSRSPGPSWWLGSQK